MILKRSNINYGMSLLKNNYYRPEIDGLRAFAVIAVIVNHLDKNIMPSGYLGVDIFFVISGYVITSSLIRRQVKDFREFIIGFYVRRIKRLVPALSVFVLVMSTLICLFNKYPGYSLMTGLASLFGLSNLYLLNQATDYFAQYPASNIFTHTWSLGVEEQFYVIFPLLIWFTGFGRKTKQGIRNLFITLSFLSILSITGFISIYSTNQSAAYFLMPLRFWEMSSGCLIFIGLYKKSSIINYLDKVSPTFIFCLILGVMYFPESWGLITTIAVVLLSSILLISLKKKNVVSNIFSHPKVMYIGLISYSLYLWHWGVLCISRWTIGISWWSIPFQLAIIFILAITSYELIEKPCRNLYVVRNRRDVFLIGGGALMAVTGWLLALGIPLKGKLYIGNSQSKMFTLPPCSAVSSGFGVVGDSHALEMSKAINVITNSDCSLELFKEYTGNSFLFTFKIKTKNDKRFREVQLISPEKFIDKIKQSNYQKLLINPYWVGFFSPPEYAFESYGLGVQKHFSTNGIKTSWNKALDQYEENIRQVISSLDKMKFILVAPEPEFNWVTGGGVSELRSCNKEWFQLVLPPDIYQDCLMYQKPAIVSRSYLEKRREHIMEKLRNLEQDFDNVFIFDPMPILCEGDICSTHDNNGQRLFRDDDHLSSFGVSKLIPRLSEFIETINQL